MDGGTDNSWNFEDAAAEVIRHCVNHDQTDVVTTQCCTANREETGFCVGKLENTEIQ